MLEERFRPTASVPPGGAIQPIPAQQRCSRDVATKVFVRGFPRAVTTVWPHTHLFPQAHFPGPAAEPGAQHR